MIQFAETKLQYFKFDHLPPNLQVISEPFYHLACSIIKTTVNIEIDNNAAFEQIEMSLQKLLEAKDCAVRACIK